MDEGTFLSKVKFITAVETKPIINGKKLDDLMRMLDYLKESDVSFFEEIFIDQIC